MRWGTELRPFLVTIWDFEIWDFIRDSQIFLKSKPFLITSFEKLFEIFVEIFSNSQIWAFEKCHFSNGSDSRCWEILCVQLALLTTKQLMFSLPPHSLAFICIVILTFLVHPYSWYFIDIIIFRMSDMCISHEAPRSVQKFLRSHMTQ